MTFLTALVLGLIASAHCAAMCSGLAQAFQSSHTLRSKSSLQKHNLLLNLGRLTSYIIIGGLLGWGSASLGQLMGAQQYLPGLRIAMAVVLFAIGLQMIFKTKPILRAIEPIGQWVWHRVKPLFNSRGDSYRRSFRNGMIWAMLPCGLLYSVFLTAAFSGSAVEGASIMLGFGLGTLPSLLLSGTVWMFFKKWFHQRNIQAAGGMFYVLGGVLVVSAPYLISMEFAQAYPGLVSTVFCLS